MRHDGTAPRRWLGTSSARQSLTAAWVVLAAACVVIMWLAPGRETVPYHVAWIGLAFAYGVSAWPLFHAVVAIAAFTVLSGAILVARAAEGAIAWEETSEIPLMCSLLVLVAVNVRRRQEAFERLTRLSERERNRAQQRETLSRITSHEMRTPATMAMGYAELMLAQESDPARRADLTMIQEELGRLVLSSDRLVRMMRLQDQDRLSRVDLRSLLEEVTARWRILADRRWVVSADAGWYTGSADRVRACVDTLVENALRYTVSGDTVRVIGHLRGDHVLIGVADSGPGMDDGLLRAIGRGELGAVAKGYTAQDPRARTGFGLALVREAAAARGGRVVAGRSAEGGALVLVSVRRHDDERTLWTAPAAPGSDEATQQMTTA